MLGLPILTFIIAIGVPVLSVILSLIYARTFCDDERWLTIEEIIEKLRR